MCTWPKRWLKTGAETTWTLGESPRWVCTGPSVWWDTATGVLICARNLKNKVLSLSVAPASLSSRHVPLCWWCDCNPVQEYETVMKGLDRNAPSVPPQNSPQEAQQVEMWKKYIQWEKSNPLRTEDQTLITKRGDLQQDSGIMSCRFWLIHHLLF